MSTEEDYYDWYYDWANINKMIEIGHSRNAECSKVDQFVRRVVGEDKETKWVSEFVKDNSDRLSIDSHSKEMSTSGD